MNMINAIKLKNYAFVALVIMLITFAIVMIWQTISTTQSSDRKFPVYDDRLSPIVSEYLISRSRGILSSDLYDSYGNLLQGQAENYCDVGIFGYDNKYIYSMVTCQEYGWKYNYNSINDEENTIKITRSLQRGTGWSAHVRLEYKEGTNFEIIDYVEPHGGTTYGQDLDAMFAPMGNIGSRDEQAIFESIQERFLQDHSNDPYPDKIERIYGLSNPKIVIGDEASA